MEQDGQNGTITLKSKYEFYINYDILGKIGTNYLLVRDKNNETIPALMHLFDFNQNFYNHHNYHLFFFF